MKQRIQTIKLGRRLTAALLNLHEANELNRGREPISPSLHTAIYLVEQCIQLMDHQNLKAAAKRI